MATAGSNLAKVTLPAVCTTKRRVKVVLHLASQLTQHSAVLAELVHALDLRLLLLRCERYKILPQLVNFITQLDGLFVDDSLGILALSLGLRRVGHGFLQAELRLAHKGICEAY